MTFLADENFRGPVIDALYRSLPGLDLVRAVDEGLMGAEDPEVLEYAAARGRVLLTHDRRTMIRHARNRVSSGQAMPGVLVLSHKKPIPEVVETIRVFQELGRPGDLDDQIVHG